MRALPEAVRIRVLALAADHLGSMPLDQVPPTLVAVRAFTPARRARTGASRLAPVLEQDPAFRQRCADRLRADQPELAEAVDSGAPLPALDPVERGAAVYLLRPHDWEAALDEVTAELQQVVATASREALDTVERLTAQLEQQRARTREDAARATEEVRSLKADAAALRRKVQELGQSLTASEAERESLLQRVAALEAAGGSAGADVDARVDARVEAGVDAGVGAGVGAAADGGSGDADSAGSAEVAALRARVAELEAAVGRTGSGSARASGGAPRAPGAPGAPGASGIAAASTASRMRHQEQVRLRVLLDTVVEAARGLTRELALPPTDERPGDAKAASYPAPDPVSSGPQGRGDDDPALLDQLLAAPQVLLVVDGYNVTRTDWDELPLETQRARLTSGLAPLAARTGAEVVVVFDGNGADRTVKEVARHVRVWFSQLGETADDLVRELVADEPRGRAVVVVSSDREVVDGVRATGARAMASRALLRLLER